MTPAEIARAMGQYIRKNGFSPYLGEPNGCGCFLRASSWLDDAGWVALDKVQEVVGTRDISARSLIRAGWTAGKRRDAAAACDIAADLLS